MKWMATMLAVALVSGAMIGCEPADTTTTPATTPPAPTTDESETTPTTGPATQASASLAIANQYCAVMSDHKADAKVTVAHAGKTVGFCCEDCIPTFQKEPAKYLASLK